MLTRRTWEGDYSHMAEGMANRLGHTPQEKEDLLGEGAEAYLKARASFDPDRGATFTTHFYWTAMGAMRKHLRLGDQRKTPHIDADIPDHVFGSTPATQESSAYVAQLVERLPRDAREVVRIVFTAPAELLAYTKNHGLRPATIVKYMHKERRWGIRRVWHAIEAIQTALKN